MKVSIIVPIYGVEKYIKNCLISLFEQTYNDIEYVFVNDCTPDNSVQILTDTIELYPNRKEQVKLINHAKNKGLGAARLTGFNTSTGEFIMHVDSDDYIPKNAVEVLVNKQTLSGADIIEGSYQKFIDDKTLFVEYPFYGSKEDRIRRIILQYNISNNIWAKIIRKSLYTEHDIFNIEGIDAGEDYVVLPRLLYFAKVASTNEVVYYYRDSDVSTFKPSYKNFLSFQRAKKVLYEFFIKNDKEKYIDTLMLAVLTSIRENRKESFGENKIANDYPIFNNHLLFRFISGLFYRKFIPYSICNFIFKLVRHIYLIKH